MKHYEKGGYDVFHYEFETSHQFLSYIQTAPINEYVFNVTDLSSHTNDYSFTETNSFDEAVKLCQKGWSGNFDKLVHLKKRIDEKLLQPNVQQRQIPDFVGYVPSVPDCLQGNPLNMWNHIDTRPPTFIDIFMNVSYLGDTKRSQIFNRGVIALCLVDALESRGYTVRFKTFACSTVDDEMIIDFHNLKDDGEKLNIKKAYFPLCHPSFLRRLVFRLRESTPVSDREWGYGYGRTASTRTIKKIIDTGPCGIIIAQPNEMGVYGHDIDSDLEAMLEFTNLQEILAKT